MKSKILSIVAMILVVYTTQAQLVDSSQIIMEQIESSLQYKTGVIELPEGDATITVPKGFKFLGKEQSNYLLTDIWNNEPDSTILGMLVSDQGIYTGVIYTVSYDPMGYVKDEDADDINYDDLLKEQQQETQDGNPERVRLGYQPIEFIGWAANPYYDADKKVLHWAKELKFGQDSINTLNYNLRILGRKGVFMLNAISTIDQLSEVNTHVNDVLGSVTFKKGSTYFDFDPDVDEVAAWTVGGLVAGKILAKVGFFALFIKFWKVIGLALVAFGGAIWKFITGKREKNTYTKE
ncbi:DUF2167 domain-containing protein [Cytophaga aurantiaca]|uniref:DUF2167 domain-containing protein n=1 Tax=Cytophaga aurantiaca TaxID=29530 RepID=UPI00035C31DD|nr:DUF2167 domain-containing protein [Cytophaga aurantiaca]